MNSLVILPIFSSLHVETRAAMKELWVVMGVEIRWTITLSSSSPSSVPTHLFFFSVGTSCYISKQQDICPHKV